MIYASLNSAETQTLRLEGGFELESGERLPEVEVAYRTWGQPGKRAILVCHALTGSADADDWWSGLFGPGRLLDPERSFIVASNVLGGCYGTSGPTSPMPGQGVHYAADFPRVSIRDMVNLQAAWLDALGVETLELVLGGSMGGMQVLEWPLLHPNRVEAIAPLAVSARHSPWCIGLSEAQRQAIRADPGWRDGYYRLGSGPRRGLAAARMMAIASYRSWSSFDDAFGRELHAEGHFEVESYMRYQGEKLVDRFDANTYIRLTEAMDSHDLGRGRGDYREVLRRIEQPALVVGIESDLLYPLREQEELVEALPNAELRIVRSTKGHDAFLVELEQIDEMLREFFRGTETGPSSLRQCS